MTYFRPDLPKLVEEYGASNLRFFIPMHRIQGIFGLPGIGFTSSSDPEVVQECVIDERRYKPEEGYKIELKAIADEDPNNYYGHKSFYVMDFESLMMRAPDDYRIYVLVDADNKYQRIGIPA